MQVKASVALLVLPLWSLWAPAQTVETISEELTGSGGVAVDARGRVYIADFGTLLQQADGTSVFRLEADGSLVTFATGLAGASGNGFDSKGRLIQSNIAANRVDRIDPDGSVTPLADNHLASPVGVAVGSDDTVYVANCGGGSLTRISPDGQASRWVADTLLQCPNGLTIDDSDNLYTSNFYNGWVVRIAPDGAVSNFAEIPGGGNGHLTFANDRLYVVGRNANQIFEVSLDGGSVTRIAGAGPLGAGPRGNADGAALEATFSIPNGIRASPDGGTLYINSAVKTTGPDLNPVLVRALKLR